MHIVLFGATESLIIEVSSFQSVLIEGFHCTPLGLIIEVALNQ